ncbi:MAG: branched-chain amino acid ABC transporter permease [Desulfomonilaceae bacterium]|nr:branched-chain amino acid ABC transporter permease [Desulfomonilaceae bacterium]
MTVSYGLVWLFLVAVYLTLAVSYDIVGGTMGHMNLGHASFFGLGAYSTVILMNQGLSFWAAVALAVPVTVLFAALISYPFTRLTGAYFALGTFGLISLMNVLAHNLRDLTGGSGGISTPPGDRTVEAYYLAVIAAGATIALSRSIARSRFGLALRSIREDADTARAFGVPVDLYKCGALVISSAPAAFIGGVYAWKATYISPSSVFGLEIALSPIVMTMLGGSGTAAGPIVGVVFLTIAQELLWTRIPYLHLAMYGVIMVIIGLLMPGGIVRSRWFRRVMTRMGMSSRWMD